MKILNVNMSLDPVTGGGTVERTFQMSRFLVKAGMGCTVLATDLGLTQARVKVMEGINVIALPCLNKRFYIPKSSYSKIKNIVRAVDIVHLMGHWTFINALVYLAVHRLNKPYVVCPAGALPIYGRSRFIKRVYNWAIGSKIIRNANAHIAIATNEINQFQDYGVTADKVSIIPNGINTGDFRANDMSDFRKKYCLGSNPFILFMGRLNFIKGPDLLLQAFNNVKNELRDYQLVFVGPDGGILTKLKKMATDFNVNDRVYFLGYLGGPDKSQAYYAADLVVIPSRQEAMSIVVLEAGITGTAILMTDQCGFDEVVSVGGGMMVPASIDGLQNGLVEILRYPAKLKSMGANLKKHVIEIFSWESVITKYIDLFKEILGRDT